MIIAIDVGGTKISAALMSNGEIIVQKKITSVVHTDLSSLGQTLVDLCQDWTEQATKIAIACTGQIGDQYVNFLSVKQKLPLKSQLETALNLPVNIINDAAAAAWAEFHFNQSTAKDGDFSNQEKTLVYITVSTGIGGGMIQNGQLVTSTDGFCAHLGHVSVQHARNKIIKCHCGRINCAEAIASGTAIAQQASIILNKRVSAKEVFDEYLAIPEITQLIEDASSAVCDLIASIKAVTGTQTIILGGSVGSAAIFHQQVITKVGNLSAIYQVKIKRPKMGTDADLIGAMLYANIN